ncbi:MAG: hypothetical protein AAF914_11680, partial [Pseudomonadota bacterium]
MTKSFSFSFLLLVAMVASSIGLSLASGLETYLGLITFTPDGLIGIAIAAIFTLSVQSILFVISWRIAQHLLDPLRAQIPSYIVFVICALFSGFFSYFGFFQATGGRDDTIRTNAMTVAQGEIIDVIEAEFDAVIDMRHADLVAPGGVLEAWEQTQRDLMRTAAASRAEIEAAAERRIAELTEDREQARQMLRAAERDLVEAQAEERLAEQRRADLRAEIERLVSLQRERETNVEEQLAVLASLGTQLETELLTGEG